MKSVIFNETDIHSLLADRKTIFRVPGKLLKSEPPFTDSKMYPPYLPGEVIFVREAFGLIDLRTGSSIIAGPPPKGNEWNDFAIIHQATMSDFEESFVYKWFSPVYMPEWTANFKLSIIDVRKEHLQDITEEDAIREGLDPKLRKGYGFRYVFGSFWNFRYAQKPEYQWEANPWVWRNEFDRVK